MEHRASEKTMHKANTNEKTKWKLSGFDSESEVIKFPRFILLQSLEETYVAKLSLFLIEKKIFLIEKNPSDSEKIRYGNLLEEVDNKKHIENLITR